MFSALGRSALPTRPSFFTETTYMIPLNIKPNRRQAALIKRRGLDPKNYYVIKELNYHIYLRDRRNGIVKILDIRR